jgi:hypothetical protein
MGRPGLIGDDAFAYGFGGSSSVWITLFRSARRWAIDENDNAESMPKYDQAVTLLKLKELHP